MNDSFVVDDLRELAVLQRVFREAKFCTEPDDVEVSASPIVANLYQRVIEALVVKEVALQGEIARQRWTQWLTIDESRDEWRAATRRAILEERWHTFSDEECEEYVRLLFSPFAISAEMVKRFIVAVNQSRVA
jgi:hypothetical protein